MNSKIIFFILSGLLITGCGVKGPPMPFPETIIDSYTQTYTGAPPTAEELERIKTKEAIPPKK